MSENNSNLNNETINIKTNFIKQCILNNKKIEDKLNVIIVISNPLNYNRRYILAKEFINRILKEEKFVNLYIVELCYGNEQEFMITEKHNKNHLQLRTIDPIWHKESMINVAVEYLLPHNWKAFAWIDADIEFENVNWAEDTLKLLNGSFDILQLFSHAVDMDRYEQAMSIFTSFSYNYYRLNKYCSTRNVNYSHSGYAWAISRNAYEKMEKLIDTCILGSGDYVMAMSIIRPLKNYEELHEKMKSFRLGYTTGVIRHYYHGSKINRQYQDRGKILVKHNFNPKIHLTYDVYGLICASEEMSKEFKDDILQYFADRKEDD